MDKSLRPLFTGGVAILAIAVGLDFFEGMELPGFSEGSWPHYLKLVEECMEMMGLTCFLVVFLRVLLKSDFTLNFKSKNI